MDSREERPRDREPERVGGRADGEEGVRWAVSASGVGGLLARVPQDYGCLESRGSPRSSTPCPALVRPTGGLNEALCGAAPEPQ